MAFLIALLGGLALTPLARLAARWRGVVDHPDGRRKLQGCPTPLWGGVAVYAALLLGVVIAGVFRVADGPALVRFAVVIAAASGLMCVIGCVDDSLDLNPRFKLLLQATATVPVILAGYWVHGIVLFGHSIALGWAGAALTMFWLVTCINAFNFLDGMDGLASVAGLLTTLMVALVAALGGHPPVVIVALALAGALAGFLVYNLPPASIYLGDSGSMVIGLVVGVLTFQSSLGSTMAVPIVVPAVMLTVPLLDTAMAVVRRQLSGRPFDAADRGHIHHRMQARGLSGWQTLCVISLLSVVSGAAAVAAAVWHGDVLACATAAGVIGLLIATRTFGDHELALLKLALAHGVSRCVRLVNSSRAGRSVIRRSALTGMPLDDAWTILVNEVKRWQARRLELVVTQVGGNTSHERCWADLGEPPLSCIHWSFSMTFSGPEGRTCRLQVSGSDAGVSQQWALVQLTRVIKPFGEHWAVGTEPSSIFTVPIARTAVETPSVSKRSLGDLESSDREAA